MLLGGSLVKRGRTGLFLEGVREWGGAVPQVEPPEKAQKQVLERKCWEDKTKFCLVLFFFAVMRSVIHYTEV